MTRRAKRRHAARHHRAPPRGAPAATEGIVAAPAATDTTASVEAPSEDAETVSAPSAPAPPTDPTPNRLSRRLFIGTAAGVAAAGGAAGLVGWWQGRARG